MFFSIGDAVIEKNMTGIIMVLNPEAAHPPKLPAFRRDCLIISNVATTIACASWHIPPEQRSRQAGNAVYQDQHAAHRLTLDSPHRSRPRYRGVHRPVQYFCT
jgi:hypothetical protein